MPYGVPSTGVQHLTRSSCPCLLVTGGDGISGLSYLQGGSRLGGTSCISSNMVNSPNNTVIRHPNLRKQTPTFSDTTSQGQGGAVPLAGCRSPPRAEVLPSWSLLSLPSPRKLVRSLLTLARPLFQVFLDTLSFLFVVCTFNGYALKAPAFSPLIMPPIFDCGRILSCCNQDAPAARPGLSDLAQAPAVLATGQAK